MFSIRLFFRDLREIEIRNKQSVAKAYVISDKRLFKMRVIFVVMKTTFRVEPMTSHLLIRSSHTWFHILVVIY